MGCLKSGHATLQDAFVGKAVQYEVPDPSRQAPIMNVLLRLFIVMLTISVAASLVSRPALSQPTPSVQVYPAPSNAPQSTQFTMLVQGQPSPVYETQNPTNPQPHQPPFEATTAWTSFAADTPVTVQVTNKTAFVSARILPSTNIVPTLTGNNGNGYTVASFTLGGGGPQQVSVEFCYTALASKQCTEQTQVLSDITNPLLVFANPLSANVPPQLPVPQVLTAPQDNNVPALGKDQTMIYFGPGFYDLGPTPYVLGQNQLGQNQVAFLAGGAYVKGMFAISDFTSIAGLGVLSGDVCAAGHGSACPMMIAAPAGRKTSGVTIRGITIVDAPYYNILLGGFGNTVSNIYSDIILRDPRGNIQLLELRRPRPNRRRTTCRCGISVTATGSPSIPRGRSPRSETCGASATPASSGPTLGPARSGSRGPSLSRSPRR